MEEGIRPKPYPYGIPAVQRPDAATLKKLDPWHVQEFFRVELLLRSESVMSLFESEGITKASYPKLVLQHWFGWEVLLGPPFHSLLPQPGRFGAIPGLAYLSFDSIAEFLKLARESSMEWSDSQILEMLRNVRDRFVGFLIDPAVPPKTALNAIRSVVEHHHRPSRTTHVKWRLHRFKIDTWIDYLACYDLRITEGLPYGQITQRVYGKKGPKAREQAETAVKRVRHYIEAAERHEWPPKRQ